VIVVEPAETPVITPPAETVATPVLEEVQGFEAAGVPEPVNVVVAFTQTLLAPVIVGVPDTVMVAVATHPVDVVNVIVVVPALTPVTKPLLLTVATAVFDDTHGFEAAGADDPVNCVVRPTQTFGFPEMKQAGTMFVPTVMLYEQAVAAKPSRVM
jgi:hypothetical protein